MSNGGLVWAGENLCGLCGYPMQAGRADETPLGMIGCINSHCANAILGVLRDVAEAMEDVHDEA